MDAEEKRKRSGEKSRVRARQAACVERWKREKGGRVQKGRGKGVENEKSKVRGGRRHAWDCRGKKLRQLGGNPTDTL